MSEITYRAIFMLPVSIEPFNLEITVPVNVDVAEAVMQMAYTMLRELYKLKIHPLDCSAWNGQELGNRVLDMTVALDRKYFDIASEWARQIPEMRPRNEDTLDYLVKLNRYAWGDKTVLESLLDYFYPIWRGFVASKYNNEWLYHRFMRQLKAELDRQLGVKHSN